MNPITVASDKTDSIQLRVITRLVMQGEGWGCEVAIIPLSRRLAGEVNGISAPADVSVGVLKATLTLAADDAVCFVFSLLQDEPLPPRLMYKHT